MLNRRNIKQQSGFTMLEVLIAVVVLSVGLLGVAGMQATSLKNNHAAYTKTQATNLASDIAERIRANPRGQAFYLDFDSNGTIDAAPNCIAAGCTPEQLAQYDLHYWSLPLVDASNTHILPQGQALIEAGTNEIIVTLRWYERNVRGIARNTTCLNDPVADIDIACFELRFPPEQGVLP